MAPAKKSKSVNKGFTSASDSSPSKDEKSKQKKRKLSDMLGPQWSKHEIERFYEAYRKYGQEWKKVAGVVRSRSIEMVEALYNMNRAYLSLPEGIASVAGLIAMMTDHYNVLAGSGSEKDSEEPEIMARKIQKKLKAKALLDSSRDDSRRQYTGSSDGCLSLLTHCGNGIRPHFPVRKRTPRIPVSCLDVHPNKKSRVSALKANDGGVSHGDLLLKEAHQYPNSPHGSQTSRRTDNIRCSHVSARDEIIAQFPVLKTRTGGFGGDEESKEGSLGHNEDKIGNLARDSADSGRYALADYKKGKKGKKAEVHHSEATLFDDIREAYKYADKGPRRNGSDGKGAKICKSTSEGERKRSKKLTFEDELAACDALKALAEMSSMMPYLAAEPASAVEDAGESMSGRDAIVNGVSRSDVALSDEKVSGKLKNKHISQGSKVWKAESPTDFSVKQEEKLSVADNEVKSADSSEQISAVSKRCKSSLRSPDVSSTNDPRLGETEVAVSSEQIANQVVNLTRRKNRRKRDRALLLKDSDYAPSGCSNNGLAIIQDEVQDVKRKLSNCLSFHEVRRWCVYEWFYSAIDYPWFAKREFTEYLIHAGLGHIPRLTRAELGFIRSTLGKPRRFCDHFLQKEREKLKQYRESVRTHYTNLRAGIGEGLPSDLACPLLVGQQVVAIHPKTRECHNGSVLTVDHDNCLVQFHRPDLGVELVMDIDCMPLNPLENMPEALRRRKMLSDYWHVQVPKVNEAIMPVSEEHTKIVDHRFHVPSFNPSIANNMKVKPACLSSLAKVIGNGSFKTETQNQSCNMAHMQFQEGHVRPIPGLTMGSDRKVFDQSSACPKNLPPWPLPVTDSVPLNETMHYSNHSAFSCQETASNVAEIVEGSRDKAQNMVDTAIKAMSIMEEGEDAFGRISEALACNGKAESAATFRTSIISSSNTFRGSLPHQNPVASCTPQPKLACDASSVQPIGDSASNDLRVPSDLITSCVATLLMIQTCTERQYPPAEVAQILDNAATSLHPCCPQNLSIYREIQMCMGRIKTQILALVPT
ncbi:protein ALWAYS EARLY 2 isoform X2 [Beta vulgaris subsp. vulgaris]|uniref:protein ALWAYS EARLY 2 isoform X2 n=1 Tax=Beta vulgaris subsp. vulgaris TaxID=3555 RepID=UPI00203748EA|nr:protein ALWAYS EARLY 2 isoform X2 [Beta vulgaris subsp. vulgaris]